MAEYIERDGLLKVLPPKCNMGDMYATAYNTCLNTIESLIKEQPTADVVPVVRCKGCKHFMEYTEDYAQIVGEADGDCYIRQMNTYYNEKFCGVKLNDYCSYGERKCDK